MTVIGDTSALEQYDESSFFPDHSRRYYGSSAHEYDMLVLARSIIGNTQNAFIAGEMIYDWTLDQWLSVVGYTNGGPRRINCHLFRAAGLPCSIAGAAWVVDRAGELSPALPRSLLHKVESIDVAD